MIETPRLVELLDRLSARGRPGDALSASEFSELVDDTRDLLDRLKKQEARVLQAEQDSAKGRSLSEQYNRLVNDNALLRAECDRLRAELEAIISANLDRSRVVKQLEADKATLVESVKNQTARAVYAEKVITEKNEIIASLRLKQGIDDVAQRVAADERRQERISHVSTAKMRTVFNNIMEQHCKTQRDEWTGWQLMIPDALDVIDQLRAVLEAQAAADKAREHAEELRERALRTA